MKSFKYYIAGNSQEDRWIYIKCKDFDFEDETAFIYFVKLIQNKYPEKLVSVGECRYRFEKSKMDLIYQWDDLFGIVIEYPKGIEEKEVIDFLEEFVE